MAISCPECGRQYDITLFQFGSAVACDCGAALRLEGDRLLADGTAPVPKPGRIPYETAPVIADNEEEFGSPIDPELAGTEPVELPIDGTLDLHTFAPSDVKDLVPDYLEACRDKGILRVRIIHGKGTGELMRTVQAILKRLPAVESFELAGPWEGGSGATIVRLQ
jgi:hypothetical protein